MTVARPAARLQPGARVSLWRQVNAEHNPLAVAGRYITLARLRAQRADPVFAASAREDVIRLATALRAVLNLHTPDRKHRCRTCAVGEFQVLWPCRSRRAVDDGLRLGYPPPADPPDPLPDAPDTPHAHEAFALSVLSLHDILPAAGGHPACCRACLVPPDACPVWALADGFLGITWSNPAGEPAPDPVGPPPPPAGTR